MFTGNGSPRGRMPETRRRASWRRSLLEFLLIFLAAFAVTFGFVRPVVAQTYKIPSESMVPTLEIGDRVFANKFIYRFSEPKPGDVVVFKSVEGKDENLIKRVVAVPGDTVMVRDGVLFVNGQARDESYVNEGQASLQASYGPIEVPPNHVFMMGDNRGNSRDSRFFGPVPVDSLEGEAFLRFWPPGRAGPLKTVA